MNLLKCHRCQGERVVDGNVQAGGFAANPMFAPSGKKFLSSSLKNGLEMKSQACLDCGLVWNSTSPKELEEFVRKHTSQEVD